MDQHISLFCGEGRLRVHIQATLTADGLAVVLTGGERPHVGGMAMSVPRSRTGRPDTWVIPRPGHRDSAAATPVAELLCRETGYCTAVIAGLHVDRATPEEIDTLLRNSQEAARQLSYKIKQIRGTEHA